MHVFPRAWRPMRTAGWLTGRPAGRPYARKLRDGMICVPWRDGPRENLVAAILEWCRPLVKDSDHLPFSPVTGAPMRPTKRSVGVGFARNLRSFSGWLGTPA